MPRYLYRKPDGSLVELAMSVASMSRRQRRDGTLKLADGTVVTRDIVSEHQNHHSTPGTWPMESAAAGVDASQVEEARQHSEQIGIPTDFTKDGEVIFRSAKHRRDYCEAVGLFDRNGGYSDPQRRMTDSQKQELRKGEANVDVI